MPYRSHGQGNSLSEEKKLRILELVNVRWWNACAQYGIDVALGLHRRGHRVIVVGKEGSPPLCEAQKLDLPVQFMEMESHHPGRLLVSMRSLLDLIRRENIQVVNAHRAEGHLFAALASSLISRQLLVVRTRGDVRQPKGHLLNRFLHRRLTDAIILPAEVLKSTMKKGVGGFPRRLVVISPGIDLSRFSSTLLPRKGRSILGWPEEDPVVGIVGRFSPVKGHRIFLEAARLVLQVNPKITFAIVGHEAQIKTAELQAQAERLNVGRRVRFTGFVPDVIPMIGAFDVAVVASTGSEVICRVALEHMAMARPVVGTRINAIPEVVADGLTGLLVPPKDPRTMSQAILSLLQDPSRARALGRAGRQRVEEHFTLDHLAGHTETLYRQLLESDPPRKK